MSNHQSGHYLHQAAKAVEAMPPLHKPKNPFLAAIIGFLFGPIGVGIYFASWRDFFVYLGLLIGLMIVIPGLGVVPGWLFSTGYGVLRSIKSNEQLR